MSLFNVDVGDEVRPSFQSERWMECTLPIGLVLLEGGVIGVIASKVFQVEPWVLALISAAPMFANLSSFLWNKLSLAKRKVQFASYLQLGVLICLLIVALSPVNQVGVVMLVTSMIASRILLAGFVTVRSVVWSLNYARDIRGQATGQLQMIASVVSIIISGSIGPYLDYISTNIAIIYITGAIAGVLGIIFLGRVKVRGEEAQLADEQLLKEATVDGPSFASVLRKDRYFRSYQISMFGAGFSNMLIEAPLIFLITRELGASYTVSIMLTMVIPITVRLVSLPAWASYLDKVHVAKFRSRQSIYWFAAQLLTMVGALLESIIWLGIARAIWGIAMAGGTLAWSLGHNDFASPKELSSYMGVHVTLTGIRGVIAPAMGIALYTGIPSTGFEGLGNSVFIISALGSAAAAVGFYRLYRRMSAEKQLSLK